MDFLQNHIEALVFCSPSPTKVADLKACLSEMFNAEVPDEDITAALQRLDEKFQAEEFSFQPKQICRRLPIFNEASLPGKYRYHVETTVEKKTVDFSYGNTFYHCLQTADL